MKIYFKQTQKLDGAFETAVKQTKESNGVFENPHKQNKESNYMFENKEKDMRNEHKTLKWCAVILALIIGIAAVAVTVMQAVPAGAPVADEIQNGGRPAVAAWNDQADTAAIKAMPEEMAALTTAHDVKVLAEQAAQPENSQNAGKDAENPAHDADEKPETVDIKTAHDADEKPETVDIKTAAGAELEGKASVQNTSAGPVEISVKADGLEMHLLSAAVTVEQALKAYGIPVGADDIVTPALEQQLTDKTEITIQRIAFEEVVESEVVPFKTKIKGTDELPAKTQKVVQKGQNGEDKVTYKITYADGVEIAREEIARERVKKPVAKIIHKSTVGTINGREYARKFTVKAYSYTGGGTTASGLPAAVGRIAVDPRVIPLGTQVYVEGYGFATAADTGGNIKGNTIDVYYNSESQCRQWGCRYITIYILK